VIAAHDGKHPARVGKLPLFYILDPGPIDPDGDIMLGFAGNRAGVAADTVAIVYYESKIQNASSGNVPCATMLLIRNTKHLT